jgi:hypothetical protein
MAVLCKWTIRIVGASYLVALALLLIGTFGLFGQERDPLSGVFLIPLGLPWVSLLDGVSDGLKPWLLALAPAFNLFILMALCRAFSRKKA